MAMQKVRRGVSTGPCRAQSQQLSLQGPRGQFRRARERAANGRAGKIITEEAGEGGGEAGERLNETANALVIPACSGKAEADSHVASSCDGVCQAGWAGHSEVATIGTSSSSASQHVTFKGQS